VLDRFAEWKRTIVDFAPNAFDRGDAGLLLHFSQLAAKVRRRYEGDTRADIDLVRIPAAAQGAVASQFSNAYQVPPGPNADEAWKFLEWLYLSDAGPNGMTPMGHILMVQGMPPLHKGDVQYYLEYSNEPYREGILANLEIARN